MALTVEQSYLEALSIPIATLVAMQAGFRYARSVVADHMPPGATADDGWPSDFPMSNFMQLMSDRAEEVGKHMAGVK
jgi:hypothetical protein